jgi:tetratricopeptide (TPR) repeat protein
MEDLEDRLLTTELYKSSYEIGVVRNNKASVYLMMALYGEEYQSLKDSLFASASYELELAESTFIDWMKQYKTISDDLIQEELLKAYSKTPKILKDKNLEKLAEQRLEDIHLAKIETPRRLSVVYTNMAIIERHTNLLDSAIAKNQRAIELWPENHEAKNNLRTLFGLEREKRGAIKKLFPSKRSEDY